MLSVVKDTSDAQTKKFELRFDNGHTGKQQVFKITREKDLDDFICKLDPFVLTSASCITREHAAAKAARILKEVQLKEDEKHIILDSGSTVDAADIEEEFVDDLPKTATGKIQRFRLRARQESA